MEVVFGGHPNKYFDTILPPDVPYTPIVVQLQSNGEMRLVLFKARDVPADGSCVLSAVVTQRVYSKPDGFPAHDSSEFAQLLLEGSANLRSTPDST